MMKLDQSKAAWLIVGLMIGLTLGAGGMTLRNQVRPAAIMITPPPPLATSAPTATPGMIQVYVNGEVAEPAVYELPYGSIVAQAIEVAGGFTADAYADIVNLAQPLSNGTQIYVPAQGEVAEMPLPITEPGTTTLIGAESQEPASPEGGMININTATLAELETLPGIGPSTAEKIVAHREENGLFATIEEIMNVSGIGEAKFNQIKDLITVGE